MKKIFAIIGLCFAIDGLHLEARQLTPAEALARITTSKRGMKKAQQQGAEIQVAYTAERDGNALLYCINNGGNNGFVIVSADDQVEPLLGYADEGRIDIDDMPDNMRWWLSQYENSISQTIAQGKSNALAKTAIVGQAVSPLVTSKWGQEDPYNKQCIVNGTRRLTGCVATAMAQIMRYHAYPEQGTGSYSYEFIDTDQNTYTVSSNFASHTYRWDLMLDSHFSGSEAQNDAVATLMKDCGVSVEMSYWKGASGAATNSVARALYTYFDYDKGVRNRFREDMTDEEWENMLIEELQASRPVLYGSSSLKEGGHAFVCDGYDGNGMFHLNWGWNGNCNGFYALTGTDALNPYPYRGDGYAFDLGQMAVVGIQPNQGTTDLPPVTMKINSGLVATDYYGNTLTSITRGGYMCLQGNLRNLGPAIANVTMGALLQNETDSYYCTGNTFSSFALNVYYLSYGFSTSTVYTNGTYEVIPVYIDNDHPELGWQRVWLTNDVTIPTIEITGTEPSLMLTSAPYLTSGGKRYADNQVKSDDMTLHLELKALKDCEDLYIYPYVFKEGEQYSTNAYDVAPLTLNKGDVINLEIKNFKYYSNWTSGEYYIQIFANSRTIPPSEWMSTYFTIVDELPEPLIGDINVDGTVDLKDLSILRRRILNNNPACDADLNEDGKVTISDLNLLINILVSQ